MLTDPRLALQKAIVGALMADTDVKAVVSDRIYDRIPRNQATGAITAEFPFIGIGDTQLLPELAECTDAAETSITIHCYSRAVGFPEAIRIAAAATAALHDAPLALDGGSLQSLLLESSRILRDPDGLTSHAVLTFNALTDAN